MAMMLWMTVSWRFDSDFIRRKSIPRCSGSPLIILTPVPCYYQTAKLSRRLYSTSLSLCISIIPRSPPTTLYIPPQKVQIAEQMRCEYEFLLFLCINHEPSQAASQPAKAWSMGRQGMKKRKNAIDSSSTLCVERSSSWAPFIRYINKIINSVIQ